MAQRVLSALLLQHVVAGSANPLNALTTYHDTRPAAYKLNTSGLMRAPLDQSKTFSRIAFGSCSKHDRPQHYWNDILARHPDLFVWLGDIHYADIPVLLKIRIPASAERLIDFWNGQLAVPEYRHAVANVPIVGIYDDHDYGANDGDRTYNATARALSQQFL